MLRGHLPLGVANVGGLEKWSRSHEDYTAYSFDVFDTLVRRRVDPPEEVKRVVALHISERLAAHGTRHDAEEILATRDRVERGLQQAARSRGMDAVAKLDDIVAGTLDAIGAAGVLKWLDVVEYEITLEKAATEPMPGLRDVLCDLRSRQKRIVAVSETYLSSSQISSILEYHGLLQYVDQLYVSCDLGKSKLTGNLFRHVLENEQGKLVHIGDHYAFDYRIPGSLKIKALWFHSRDEQRRRRGLRRLSAGDNRLAYVNAIVGRADPAESQLFCVGHDILGPALTVFVHCVAERAMNDDVDKVFFVARDGFLLKKVYQILQNNMYPETNLPPARYLCLSRLAVRRASIPTGGLSEADVTEAFRYLAPRKKFVTLADILSSYGLEPDSLAQITARHGIDANLAVLDPADDSIQGLLQDDEFRVTIAAQGRLARDLLRSYLRESGFLGSQRAALVDATSEGLTQALLKGLFSEDKDYPEVYGYYFTLVNLGVANPGMSRDVSTAWGIVNDWRTGMEAHQGFFRRFGLFLELFSHPNHGVTTGYKKADTRTVPVFRGTPQETQYPLTSQGLEGILAYARTYATCYKLHRQSCQDLLEEVRTTIRQWVASPPTKHVRALRGLYVTSDWPTETRHPLMNRGSHLSPTTMCRTLFRRRSL